MCKQAIWLVFALSILVGCPTLAQSPNPLDVVPDKMPFDIPYGPPITLDAARAVIAAAEGEAKKHDWKMNIAVFDSGANLVAFARMDGAMLFSIAIAEHKARTSVMLRRETKAPETFVQNGGPGLTALTADGIIAIRGGLPLIQNGVLIGAIGVSGGTGSQDEVVAKAGVAAFGTK